MDLQRFGDVVLLLRAREYRQLLDDATTNRGWAVAASIATLFVEGTAYERHELDPSAPARPQPPLEDHPLVRHYGLPVECLALTKAHRSVEGEHRQAAWRMMIHHVPAGERSAVVRAMSEAVDAWRRYRDDVAEACGITREAIALAG
jgi:pyrroloquinoline-quinone synthase